MESGESLEMEVAVQIEPSLLQGCNAVEGKVRVSDLISWCTHRARNDQGPESKHMTMVGTSRTQGADNMDAKNVRGGSTKERCSNKKQLDWTEGDILGWR